MLNRIVDWIRGVKQDKWLHLLCGLGVAQVAYAVLSLAMSWWCGAVLAFAFAVSVGAVKEAIDVKYGVASWSDFLFTCAGGLLGVLLLIPMAI